MGVTFRPRGRLHYLDPADFEFRVGDAVRVPTENGAEVGTCTWGPATVEWAGPPLPLALGPATDADLARDARNRERRAELRSVAADLIARHRLPMTVVAVDLLDRDADAGRVVVLYFKAPHRVDFRALVGDLARKLRARIDLRQVGARDVCALVGGVGACGRETCCSAGCPLAEPLPSKISQDQEAANAALQLAGACGRMKCCLAYEADAYADFVARAPAIGSVVATGSGEGVVSGHAMPVDAVWVREADGIRAVAVADTRVVEPAPHLGPRRGSAS